MKGQEIILILLTVIMILRNRSVWTTIGGLVLLGISIPLFYAHIFYTAERLTWFAILFFLIAVIQNSISLRRINIRKFINPKTINILLILIMVFNIGFTLDQYQLKYQSTNYWERYKTLEKEYKNSQYVSKNPEGWIPDEIVNAYAGGAYIRGENPILIAADTPPLGRYLIGLSALLTGNENRIILLSSIMSLLLMFILGRQIFSNTSLALVPPALFSFEPIFKNQLIFVPLLDIIQLPFLLLSFICFNSAFKSNNWKKFLLFIFANIALGCFISVKFYITGITIIASWVLLVILKRRWKNLIPLVFALPFSLLTLFASYARVLYFNSSIREFIGIQKWVYLYHQSQLILPFSVWPLILLNKWYVWYGDTPVISDPQWMVTWPIIQVITLITIALYVFQKKSHKIELEIIMIWSILYILFLSMGTATTRYFVIYLPFLYIIAVFGIKTLIESLIVKNKVK